MFASGSLVVPNNKFGFTGAGDNFVNPKAEKVYESIRSSYLDDVDTISKNSGLTLDEARALKKHIFFGKHRLPEEDGGWVLQRFTADEEAAFAWQRALKGELNQNQKAWFRQWTDHELGERSLVGQGIPYRYQGQLVDGEWVPTKPGAHDLAPAQPEFGTFDGFDPMDWF